MIRQEPPGISTESSQLSAHEWLQRKNFEERSANFRAVWEVYLKFYTAMLALNVGGVILAVWRIDEPRKMTPIAAAFMLLNLFAGGIAYGVARYSRAAAPQLRRLAAEIDQHASGVAARSPLAWALTLHAATASLLSHLTFLVVWGLLPFR